MKLSVIMIFALALRLCAFASWRLGVRRARKDAKPQRNAKRRQAAALRNLLLVALALLKQQIVSFHDYLISGFQAIDDFHSIPVSDSQLNLALLVALSVSDKDDALAAVVENGGLWH